MYLIAWSCSYRIDRLNPIVMSAKITNLNDLTAFLSDHREPVEQWVAEHWHDHPAPFYSSMDIRTSAFKLACVDANLFPGGFNNLHADCHPILAQSLKSATRAFCRKVDGVLLVAEKIDNNPYYLENLHVLQSQLNKGGIPTRLVRDDIKEGQTHVRHSESGAQLTFYPLRRKGQRLWSGSWSPCAVLLNNDLSSVDPADIALFKDVEQTILPIPQLGWLYRRKSEHFEHYSAVVKSFCQHFDIDSWLLDPTFEVCENIDILNQVGLDCIAKHCQSVLDQTRAAYQARDIEATPMCFVKSNQGTHGLGIILIGDPEEIYTLNRKKRKSMSYGKFGTEVNNVMIQECIPSQLLAPDGAVAENVMYMVNHDIVGGFLRLHAGKNPYHSLNVQGMRFLPLTHQELEHKYYSCQVVAKLSLIACAKEELAQDSARARQNLGTTQVASI